MPKFEASRGKYLHLYSGLWRCSESAVFEIWNENVDCLKMSCQPHQKVFGFRILQVFTLSKVGQSQGTAKDTIWGFHLQPHFLRRCACSVEHHEALKSIRKLSCQKPLLLEYQQAGSPEFNVGARGDSS